jgi:hypothetical protein
MNPNSTDHSAAWVAFTYAMFVVSVAMVALGIVFLPTDLAIKGYLAMGIAMLVQSCITVTKAVRDVQERGRLVNRIENAKTERLLMEIDRAK